MSKEKLRIEELFQKAYKGHTIAPSDQVLQNIRKKLWWSDFLSLKPAKWNIFYTGIILAGLASGPAILKKVKTNTPNTVSVEALPVKSSASNEEVNIAIEKTTESSESDKKSTKQVIIEEIPETPRLKAYFQLTNETACAPYTVRPVNKSLAGKSYLWKFGEKDEFNIKNPSFTFNKSGEFQITLIVRDEKGNKDTFSKKITIYPRPTAAIDIDVKTSEIETRKISFKNLSKGGNKYHWQFGDKGNSDDKDPTHAYDDYGVYNVNLICTSKNGCSDTATLVNKFIEKNYKLAFPLTFRPNPTSRANNGFYESAGQQGAVFYPKNYGANSYELSIFAPNGIKVFTSENIKQGWNGFIRGRMAPGGNYRYSAKGIYPNGKPFLINGSFKLMVDNVYDYYQ